MFVDDVTDALPTDDAVGRFKRRFLESVIARTGIRVVAAYGNAATDVCAFARAGIPPRATFILREEPLACVDFDAPNTLPGFQGHDPPVEAAP